tara:strand:- start:316 stop:525 length:210 start_codon:yes stop_codon:yes gene_type:complete
MNKFMRMIYGFGLTFVEGKINYLQEKRGEIRRDLGTLPLVRSDEFDYVEKRLSRYKDRKSKLVERLEVA